MTPSDPSIPYGYCHCGCGEKTLISPRTRGSRGNKKGEPLFYVNGHNAKQHPIIEKVAPFKIEGVYCRLIPLTQGQFAIVDASDYEWLMQWKWQAKKHENGFYAQRSKRKKGQVIYISMHREILGLGPSDESTGDHINRLPLDNRRANLRKANTWQQQMFNRGTGKNNKFGCKGISLQRGRYRVRIYIDGKSIELGIVDTLGEARILYEQGALKYHGEFACVA